MSDQILWKALNGRTPTHGDRTYQYPVGQWTRHLDNLKYYERGYHLAPDAEILRWLAPNLYTAEPCPDHGLVITGHDKVVTCRVRITPVKTWTPQVLAAWASDCAEHVQHHNNRAATEAATWADGAAAIALLYGAAEAAKAATWAAARAARAAGDARYAAGVTARDAVAARDAADWAAVAAARDAVGVTARATEREWQYQQLLQYLKVGAGGRP